jgi:hypothetical protein
MIGSIFYSDVSLGGGAVSQDDHKQDGGLASRNEPTELLDVADIITLITLLR